MGELDDALDAARAAEKTLSDASVKNPDPTPADGGTPVELAIRRAGKTAYTDYVTKAKDARNLFYELTGLQVGDAQLAPALPV